MPDTDRPDVGDELTARTLPLLKMAVTHRLNADAITAVRDAHLDVYLDRATRQVVTRLTTQVLSEQLPPATYGHTIDWTVPRLATWRDMFAATHRGRWWGRIIGLHRYQLRYVDEPHTRHVYVTVRQHWTYPDARLVLPGGEFGHVRLWTTTDAEDYPR